MSVNLAKRIHNDETNLASATSISIMFFDCLRFLNKNTNIDQSYVRLLIFLGKADCPRWWIKGDIVYDVSIKVTVKHLASTFY